MTDNLSGPPLGPLNPQRDRVGLSAFGWIVYRAGDRVCCPGTMVDRRAEPYRRKMGDRRTIRRIGACPYWYGRVGANSETWIRVKRMGSSPTPDGTLLLDCPDCNSPIESYTHAASNEAA